MRPSLVSEAMMHVNICMLFCLQQDSSVIDPTTAAVISAMVSQLYSVMMFR
jgi:hypothetical protein